MLLRLFVIAFRGAPKLFLGVAGAAMMLAWVVWPAGWIIRLDVLLGFATILPSLTLHEYGHARAARLLGAKRVEAGWINGTMAVGHDDLGAVRNMLASLAGPALSGFGGGLLIMLGVLSGFQPLVVTGAVLGLLVATLVPPLHDGRTIVRCLLLLAKGKRGSNEAALSVSDS